MLSLPEHIDQRLRNIHEALKMYEKSVELNPNSKNGKKILKALKL